MENVWRNMIPIHAVYHLLRKLRRFCKNLRMFKKAWHTLHLKTFSVSTLHTKPALNFAKCTKLLPRFHKMHWGLWGSATRYYFWIVLQSYIIFLVIYGAFFKPILSIHRKKIAKLDPLTYSILHFIWISLIKPGLTLPSYCFSSSFTLSLWTGSIKWFFFDMFEFDLDRLNRPNEENLNLVRHLLSKF